MPNFLVIRFSPSWRVWALWSLSIATISSQDCLRPREDRAQPTWWVTHGGSSLTRRSPRLTPLICLAPLPPTAASSQEVPPSQDSQGPQWEDSWLMWEKIFLSSTPTCEHLHKKIFGESHTVQKMYSCFKLWIYWQLCNGPLLSSNTLCEEFVRTSHLLLQIIMWTACGQCDGCTRSNCEECSNCRRSSHKRCKNRTCTDRKWVEPKAKKTNPSIPADDSRSTFPSLVASLLPSSAHHVGSSGTGG